MKTIYVFVLCFAVLVVSMGNVFAADQALPDFEVANVHNMLNAEKDFYFYGNVTMAEIHPDLIIASHENPDDSMDQRKDDDVFPEIPKQAIMPAEKNHPRPVNLNLVKAEFGEFDFTSAAKAIPYKALQAKMERKVRETFEKVTSQAMKSYLDEENNKKEIVDPQRKAEEEITKNWKLGNAQIVHINGREALLEVYRPEDKSHYISYGKVGEKNGFIEVVGANVILNGIEIHYKLTPEEKASIGMPAPKKLEVKAEVVKKVSKSAVQAEITNATDLDQLRNAISAQLGTNGKKVELIAVEKMPSQQEMIRIAMEREFQAYLAKIPDNEPIWDASRDALRAMKGTTQAQRLAKYENKDYSIKDLGYSRWIKDTGEFDYDQWYRDWWARHGKRPPHYMTREVLTNQWASFLKEGYLYPSESSADYFEKQGLKMWSKKRKGESKFKWLVKTAGNLTGTCKVRDHFVANRTRGHGKIRSAAGVVGSGGNLIDGFSTARPTFRAYRRGEVGFSSLILPYGGALLEFAGKSYFFYTAGSLISGYNPWPFGGKIGSGSGSNSAPTPAPNPTSGVVTVGPGGGAATGGGAMGGAAVAAPVVAPVVVPPAAPAGAIAAVGPIVAP